MVTIIEVFAQISGGQTMACQPVYSGPPNALCIL